LSVGTILWLFLLPSPPESSSSKSPSRTKVSARSAY
jgi:hypothetical protein